jgi:hypothetical protein
MRCKVNKKVTALALAVAGFATQDAFATVTYSAVSVGSVLQIGCTAPGATGATVYSIDANAINTLAAQDTIQLPSGVSAGASCSYALGQIAQFASLTGTNTGRWVAAGLTVTGSATGAAPVNITIPGSGYSLQQYTFVAQ